MKITLTINEVKEAVARALGWQDKEFTLMIEGYGEPELSCEVVRVLEAMRPFFHPNGEIRSDMKIPAIKCLRDLFPDTKYVPNPSNPRDYRPSLLGLGQAKNLVENWTEVIAKAKKHGSFLF